MFMQPAILRETRRGERREGEEDGKGGGGGVEDGKGRGGKLTRREGV